MKKRLIVSLLVFVLVLVISIFIAYGHEEDQTYMTEKPNIYPVTTWQVVGYGTLAFGILVVIMLLFHTKMNNNIKRLVFFLVVTVTSLVTIFLIVSTLHLNIVSQSKGPVHWHADYEIWDCNNQIQLFAPSGLSNEQGTGMLHSHDDNRIHVEGVLMDIKSASLGAFFQAIGGYLNDDSYKVISRNGIVEVHNGDSCNGQPASLHVFVNGKLIEHPDDYVISPYENVPPGDRINIIFTEKPVDQIDPYIQNDHAKLK